MATRGRGIGAVSSDIGNVRRSVPCPRRPTPAPPRSPPARCPETPESAFGFDRNQCSDSVGIIKRMRAKLKAVKDQLKQRRHQPIPVQGRWLASVVGGHMAYYAVPGNTKAVAA